MDARNAVKKVLAKLERMRLSFATTASATAGVVSAATAAASRPTPELRRIPVRCYDAED